MTDRQPPQNLPEALTTAIALAERQAIRIRHLTDELEQLHRDNLVLLELLRSTLRYPAQPTTPADIQPFLGFHDNVTLTKAEVLDAVAALEEIIWDLGAAGRYDQAEQLARTREVLLTRLRRR